MARETLATTAANAITADIAQPHTADQLIAVCGARAQLATATALLDVADAIRGNGKGGRG